MPIRMWGLTPVKCTVKKILNETEVIDIRAMLGTPKDFPKNCYQMMWQTSGEL